MKLIAIAVVVAALAGCAGSLAPVQNMTPEQLKELAKAKDANVVCTKAGSAVLGTVTNVYVNVDRGVIQDGAVIVSGDTCDVSITNVAPHKP